MAKVSVAPPGLLILAARVPGVALGLRPALHPWLPAVAPSGAQDERVWPHPSGARSAELVDGDLVVADARDLVGRGGDGEVVDVRHQLLLPQRLLVRHVVEEEEALAGAAGAEEPRAVRRPREPVHQPDELVAGEL